MMQKKIERAAAISLKHKPIDNIKDLREILAWFIKGGLEKEKKIQVVDERRKEGEER